MNQTITTENNLLRVFKLPNSYPSGFCFGGGNDVNFKMVDWFNPVRPDLLGGSSDEVWESIKGDTIEFINNKRYIEAGSKYLVITSFDKCEIFVGGL